jgi:hypothetical protein
MPDLTPEQRHQIYLEEKERERVRAQIQGQKSLQNWIGCGGIFLILLVLGKGCAGSSTPSTDPANPAFSAPSTTLPVDTSAPAYTSAAPPVQETKPEPPPAPMYQLKRLAQNGTREYDYITVTGEVKNIGNEPLKDVEAVTTFYDANGNFVDTSSALIEYNPILAGQTSPFKTIHTDNPAFKHFNTKFQFLMGGEIPTDESADAPGPSGHHSRRRRHRHAGG